MDTLINLPKVIGTKETLKNVQKDKVSVVYIAKDAESRVVGSLEELARQKGVQIIKVPSMKELGRAFGIEVGAAAAGILKK